MHSAIDVTITAYKTWPASSESAEQAEAVLVATPVLITGFGEFEPSADTVVVSDNFDDNSVTIVSEIISSFDAEYIIENVWRGRSGAGGGATNLSFTRSATTVTVTSDTGTDAQLPEASGTLAGVLTAAGKTKLDGIEAGAQVNPTSAQIVAAIDAQLGQVVWKQGSPEYEATAYGVVGDGTTDDGPALRALVTTVETAGGGTIVLPAGTIKLSRGALSTDGCVSLPSGVNLRGAGRDVTTIITVDPVDGDIEGVIRTKNGVSVNDVTISDLSITPGTPSGTGGIVPIVLHNGYNIHVERVAIYASHAGTSNIGHGILVNTSYTKLLDLDLSGIAITGITNTYPVSAVTIENVIMGSGIGSAGISFDDCDFLTIRNCLIGSVADSGIIVANSSNLFIEGTSVTSGVNGINLNTVDVAVIEAWVAVSDEAGISLTDCTNCKIVNTTVQSSSQAGNGSHPDVLLAGTTTRTLISGCTFLSQATNKSNYAVSEETPSSADDNHMSNNVAVGQTSGPYSLEGARSTYTGIIEANAATKAFIGCTYDTLALTVSSNGTTITATVEKEGTGAFTGLFSTGAHRFTTVPLSVSLTAGTNVAPQKNYVYILASNKTLTANTSGWPAAEHIPIGVVLAQSAASAQSDGIFAATHWDAHVYDPSDNGHIIHQNLWAHEHPPLWISGVALTVDVTSNVGVDDDIDIAVTTGEVLKLHKVSFPALDTRGSASIYVANSSVAAYTKVGTLGTVLKTHSGGGAIANNQYANVVIWGTVSELAGTSKLFANLPSGFYNNQANALADNQKRAVYTIPTDFRGCAFLISRLVFKYTTADGGTWELVGSYDLRGQEAGLFNGGNAAPVSTQFADNAFTIYDDSDPTKVAAFQASGITAGQTRTMTVPDASGTLALLEVAQSFSAGAKKTFSHSATTAGMNVAPTAGDPSSPVDGDIWYNSTTNKFRKRQNGTTEDLDTQGSASPQGSDNQFQYNNGGVFGGASGLAYNETDNRPQVTNGLEIGKTGTANPGANLVALRHVDELSLLPRLRMTNTDGSIIHIGPTPVGNVQIGNWWAWAESNTVNNGDRLTLSNHGSGTLNSYLPTNSSEYSKMLRVRASTSTSSNITAGVRSGVRWMMLDHGFYARMRFGISTPATGWSGFVGLANSAAALSGGSDPSSYTNILGFAWDTADTNLKFMHNDGSGAATTVDLGSDYPTGNTDTDIYDVAIYVDPTDNATVYYSIERIIGGSGQTTNGSVTTNLPAVGTALGFQMFASNRSSAVAISFDLMGAYWETFF